MADIVRTEDVLGGAPRIDGTRVGVLHVHDLVVAGDHDPADVAYQLDVPLEAVYSALAYYYDHPTVMREVRQHNESAETELARRSMKPPTSSG